DGRAERCLVEKSAVSEFAAFGPDSRLLAYQCADGNLVVQDLSAGRSLGQWPLPGPRMHWSLAFSPDSRRLAAGTWDQGRPVIQVRELPTGKVLASLPHRQGCTGLFWHPDGVRLAVACDDLRIHLWDVAAQRELAAWEGHKRRGIQFLGANRSATRLATTD